jgi:hypothetical protein
MMTEQSDRTGFLISLLSRSLEKGFDAKIVRVTVLDPPEPGARCCRCQQRKTLHWYIEDCDGAWGLACGGCGEALLEKLRRRGDAET